VRRLWVAFLLALGCTALLALAVGAGVSRLAGGDRPPPELRTVPLDALSGAGITLADPEQPPYCETERALAQRGWLSDTVAGCPISRQAAAAAAAALPAGQGSVREATLARVSDSGGGRIGQNRLAWLVVVHSDFLMLPTTRCAPPRASGPACASSGLGLVSSQAVVVVDGASGQVLAIVPVPDQGHGA
jgi:hypothetical protein